MNSLAIIIPTYKIDYLERVLISLENQTCKDFNVYIGNDCSPCSIEPIVNRYRNKINIDYCEFNTNLGGANLVAQWERCIRLSKNEKWIWLFSDDDEMDDRCVELFYKTIEETHSSYDIYHFDVKCIDSNSKIIYEPRPYPDIIGSYDFYCAKMLGRIQSFVVENIFSRDIWEKNKGFQQFDLAWGSDTASWVKFMQYTGMYTIRGAHVYWRNSSVNISPNNSDFIVVRKLNSLLDYYNWANSFFYKNRFYLRWINLRSFVNRMVYFKQFISWLKVKECTKIFCSSNKMNWLYYFILKYIEYR